MKKTLLITIISTMLGMGAVFGTTGTQSLSINDNGAGGLTATSGSYNPTDTFSFDVSLTFAGYNAFGLSFWLEAENGIAPNLVISSVTYGTAFPDNTQNATNAAFNTTTGASAGFMAEGPDLGSTVDDPTQDPAIAPNTYLVATINFTLSGATPGTYTLQSTTVSPKVSQVADENFVDHPLASVAYTITIIPEPSTLALIGVTAVAGALIARRRRAIRG